jgi:hypothetical protein
LLQLRPGAGEKEGVEGVGLLELLLGGVVLGEVVLPDQALDLQHLALLLLIDDSAGPFGQVVDLLLDGPVLLRAAHVGKVVVAAEDDARVGLAIVGVDDGVDAADLELQHGIQHRPPVLHLDVVERAHARGVVLVETRHPAQMLGQRSIGPRGPWSAVLGRSSGRLEWRLQLNPKFPSRS